MLPTLPRRQVSFAFTGVGAPHEILILICTSELVLHTSISQDAGWSSLVARQAHNLKAAGSNPAPATNFRQRFRAGSHLKRTGSCPPNGKQRTAARQERQNSCGHRQLVGSRVCSTLVSQRTCRRRSTCVVCAAFRNGGGQFDLLCDSGRRRWSNAGAAVRRIDLCSTSNCIGCYRGTRLLQNNFPRNCAPSAVRATMKR